MNALICRGAWIGWMPRDGSAVQSAGSISPSIEYPLAITVMDAVWQAERNPSQGCVTRGRHRPNLPRGAFS